LRSRALKPSSSSHFASAIVQVNTEANASPTITALTSQSALRNMPQAERSRGSIAEASVSGAGCTSALGGASVICGRSPSGAGLGVAGPGPAVTAGVVFGCGACALTDCPAVKIATHTKARRSAWM
jgi:hypothetical protein